MVSDSNSVFHSVNASKRHLPGNSAIKNQLNSNVLPSLPVVEAWWVMTTKWVWFKD